MESNGEEEGGGQNDMTLPREARKSRSKIFLPKLRMRACESKEEWSFNPGISSLNTEGKVLGMVNRADNCPEKRKVEPIHQGSPYCAAETSKHVRKHNPADP